MLIDKISNLFYGDETAKRYLLNNEAKWDLFLHRYEIWERDELKRKMYGGSPLLAMSAIRDYFTQDQVKIDELKKRIAKSKGEIWIIAGRKGSGKTATGYWLLELAHAAGRECVISGPPQVVPKWAKRVSDPATAPDGSAVFIVEAAIQYGARTSMVATQRDDLTILPILRHSGRIIIAETQSTRAIDVALIRLMDALVLKPEPLYSLDERHPLKFVIDVLRPKFCQQTLIYTGDWFTFIRKQPLPAFWNDDFSMPYRPIHADEEATKYALELADQGYTIAEARRILIARSFNRPIDWWIERLSPEMRRPEEVPIRMQREEEPQHIRDEVLSAKFALPPENKRRPPEVEIGEVFERGTF